MTRTVALLLAGSTIPVIGWCHWEGFAAADPSTPAAVLRLENVAERYTEADTSMVPWRALFAGDGDSGEAAGSRATEAGANAGPSGTDARPAGMDAGSSGADARSSSADDARRAPAPTAQ